MGKSALATMLPAHTSEPDMAPQLFQGRTLHFAAHLLSPEPFCKPLERKGYLLCLEVSNAYGLPLKVNVITTGQIV